MTTSARDKTILYRCQPAVTARAGRDRELLQLGEEMIAAHQQTSQTHQWTSTQWTRQAYARTACHSSQLSQHYNLTIYTVISVITITTNWMIYWSSTDIHSTKILHWVSTNKPNLASCSFIKRGLILIILGKQHQHTFKKLYVYSTFLVPPLLLTLSCWSMKKAVMCMHEGERTLLWTSAKIKLVLFRGTGSFQSHQQSTEKNALCFESFPLQLFKSKWSKQKWRDKESWICIWFLKGHWSCLSKIIKISPCLTKLLLAKVDSFLGHNAYEFIVGTVLLTYRAWTESSP